MKADANNLKFRSIKVSAKGRITLPSDMQKEMGIKKGDEIILVRKGEKIILEKSERITNSLKNEFVDIKSLSEQSLRKLWLNKDDEIWKQYVKK